MTQGYLRKLKNQWEASDKPLLYFFRLNDQEIPLNDLIGKTISLHHTEKKQCIACGRDIKKTFQQGYCFPCTQRLAETDLCIVKPELCHFHKGTCRDEDFARKHCFIPHVVYLSLTSGPKVGITREHQKFTRWADQGAVAAIEVAHVPDRKTAGFLEVEISKNISDKTNWRKMLQGETESVDLEKLKKDTVDKFSKDFKKYIIENNQVYQLTYPVEIYPTKIKSYNFDKNPEIHDKLLGIKGQYLIFENGVINIRKFQGYEIEMK